MVLIAVVLIPVALMKDAHRLSCRDLRIFPMTQPIDQQESFRIAGASCRPCVPTSLLARIRNRRRAEFKWIVIMPAMVAPGKEAGRQDRSRARGRVHVESVRHARDRAHARAWSSRGGITVAHALLHILHAPPAIDGQQLNEGVLSRLRSIQDDFSASAVQIKVAPGFRDYNRKASGCFFIQPDLARQQGRLAAGFANLALVVYGYTHALRHGYFHRVIATRVPSPTLEEISNSFTSLLEPLKPRPSPDPVV